MKNEKIETEKIYNHWITTSDKDYNTMIHLYEVRDYHWSLFIGHIVIERLLKAKIVKETGEHAPFTHDLRRLSKLSKIEFQNTQINWLDTITTFNLNARYDSYKQAFYEKCSPEFTSEWIANIKELRKWIKQML